MIPVCTYIVYQGDGTVELRFFTSEFPLDKGLWNIDTNEILLTPSLYEEWRSLVKGKQADQRKFFDRLVKVSEFFI